MERSMISRGKTVADAIELAQRLLGVPKEDIDIEILETGTKGLFGIGAKPAVIKAIVNRKMASPESSLEASWHDLKLGDLNVDEEVVFYSTPHNKSTNEESGKVWVKDGRIQAKETAENYPLISPVKHARIKKNGVLIDRTVTVTASDNITIEFDEEIVEPVWNITLSESLMEATLHITPGYRIHRRLADTPPSTHANLNVEEIKEAYPIEPEQIKSYLIENLITYGWNEQNIITGCCATEIGSYRIAEGVLPTPGEHGRFEMTTDTSTRTVKPKVRPDGTIDYREIKEFPTVSAGQILGVIIPPVPGEPGVNIKGEPVPPLPVKEVIPMEGQGTLWTEQNRQAVAVRPGMPHIHQHGNLLRVSIMPKLMHGGDVNIETGNIHFQGDVEITGSVQDYMKVEATGNILVHQNVNMANLNASRSLIVHANIISSKITVGKGNMLHMEMEPLLKDIAVKVRQVKAGIEQISHAAAFKMTDFQATGLRPLLDVLLRGKFRGFKDLLVQLYEKILSNRGHLDEEWAGYAGEIQSGFLNPVKSHFRSLHDLDRFLQHTEYLHSMVEPPLENAVFAKFVYSHNSNIYSGGDLSVNQGCYNCMVYCQGTMVVDGFVKGGVYFANKGLHVHEAGTDGSSIKTKLHVPETSSVHIRTAYPGTTVQVGKRFHQFQEETSRVHARLDPEGNLILF